MPGRDPAGPAHQLRQLRTVNAPVRLQVRTGADGTPARLQLRGRARTVDSVQERWRVDEGWWQDRPVSRLYWRLVLDDGRLVTVFQDLEEGTWWSQRT